MTDNPLIEIRHLSKVFGEKPSSVLERVAEGQSKQTILDQTGHTLGLKDINLTIKRGETFVVMGLSGSGKSTLIRHFNRLIDPTQGKILVEGNDIMSLAQSELENFRRHKMSMVFQRFALLPHRTVLDNIAFGLELQGLAKEQRNKKANHWLEVVGLAGYGEQFPSQLSGGQQQRVGLARALATDAEILLMDEAFSALDPLIRNEMQDQLITLQQQLKKTIVFITHDLDEALRLGDRIAILKDGELVQVGTPAQILLTPQDDYVEAFVRSVNRARALTVENVMQPPAHRISADTINEALVEMRKAGHGYAFNVTPSGYQGMLTRESLEKSAAKDGDATLTEESYQPITALRPDEVIEEVLVDTINSEAALPVVDGDGNLAGQLDKQAVAQLFDEKSSAPV